MPDPNDDINQDEDDFDIDDTLSILKGLKEVNEKLKTTQFSTDVLLNLYLELHTLVTGAYEVEEGINEEVLDVVISALKNQNNDSNSTQMAYIVLYFIADSKDSSKILPKLAKFIDEELDNIQNDLTFTHSVLGLWHQIADNYPQYALKTNVVKNILKNIKTELSNPQREVPNNIFFSLNILCQYVPSLSSEILGIIKDELHKPETNIEYLPSLWGTLNEIAAHTPQYRQDIANLILQHPITFDSFPVLTTCMKSLRPADFPDLSEKEKNILKAAHKMRHSFPGEISYAYERYGIDKIASTNIISRQQACHYIIVAQSAREQNLPKEDYIHFRKHPKDTPIYSNNADWIIPSSFAVAEIFGSNFQSYLKKTKGYLSVHDALYWLPQNLTDTQRQSFAKFITNNIIYADITGKKQARSVTDLEIIANNWKNIPDEVKKQSYKTIKSYYLRTQYDASRNQDFAAIAAKLMISKEDYRLYENIYIAGLNVPEPFDSQKHFHCDNYTGRFLPRDDIRTGFFGTYVNCCQHFLGGNGKDCAFSTVKDPYSQLFVIEDASGNIVAGSWVWENTDRKYREVCFDNIEAKKPFIKNKMINSIYEKVGKYLTEEENCHKVTIGLGASDALLDKYPQTSPVPLPQQYQQKYSDAKFSQVLLAENPHALPLDKSTESLRFIRDVCYLDIDDMKEISRQCFPESDQELRIPSDLSGLVLVDKEKGVVGYCLYDEEEKCLYDMAVLPEYRRDRNASSGRLLSATVKRLNDLGGEWNAELRDKTTYRYLKLMADKGVGTFQNNGISYKMSDGSKVYNVNFQITPVSNRLKSGGR